MSDFGHKAFHESCAHGRFDRESGEYVVTGRRTPRPWINTLWNEEFLSIVTQTAQGYGFHQDASSMRTDIVAGRRVYLQDEESGETWMADGMDGVGDPGAFVCRHGIGYTIISIERHGVCSSLRVFLPPGRPCEIWTLRLSMAGGGPRRIRVVASLDSRIDGEAGLQGYYTRCGSRFDPALGAVVFHAPMPDKGGDRNAFFGLLGRVDGFDCRHDSFHGPYSRDVPPCGVREAKLSCTPCCDAEKSAFALERRVEVTGDGPVTLHFLAGHYREVREIAVMREELSMDGAVECAFGEACRRASGGGGLAVRTGQPVFDHWCNVWLPRQLAYNAAWARDYFNGYRDLCQDVESLSILDPGRAKGKLREILSYQYPDGYAPRAWLDGRALDHGHSDSPVWINFCVRALVLETGDRSLLGEVVPYYGEGSGTVYDHCHRAVEWLWKDRGANGLCLFRKGDWNDAMVRMGWEGRGTSVWLTMAFHRALLDFAELSRIAGISGGAERAVERAQAIREAVERHAWDGAWYVRGFTDAGDVVGSSRNREGTLYANTQSWAVISGVAGPERARQAMESLDAHLDGPTGVLTLKDPYTAFDIAIGPITGQRPGFYQNQSVYCHSNAFKIMADCMLGRTERAWRGLRKILPFGSDRLVCHGEPYVLPNSYFGPKAGYRHDHPGQSWKTGTAGWVLRILVERFFGLQPVMEGLAIRPQIPSDWRDGSITRPFRGGIYRIHYRRDPRLDVPLAITMDGVPVENAILPPATGRTVDVHVRHRPCAEAAP